MTCRKFLILFTMVLQFGCFNTAKYLENQGVSAECRAIILEVKDKIRESEIIDIYTFNFTSQENKLMHEEYIDFAKRISLSDEFSSCFKGLAKEDLMKIFGEPKPVQMAVGKYRILYVFDFGYDCPCADCPEVDKLQNCNYLSFTFSEEEKVTGMSMSLSEIGW